MYQHEAGALPFLLLFQLHLLAVGGEAQPCQAGENRREDEGQNSNVESTDIKPTWMFILC